MITAMLVLLISRYYRRHSDRFRQLFRRMLLLLFCCLQGALLPLPAQERSLLYTVKRAGNPVGTLAFKETKAEARTTYRLESQVRASFLLTFDARTREEAVYENGVLLYSSFYRRMNGKEKANKHTRATGNGYIIEQKSGSQALRYYPIRYTTLCLFTREPLSTTQVFSDNHQRFLSIERTAAHQYRIRYPDGSWGDYYYRDGLCVKIRINHRLYDADIELSSGT